MGGAPLLVPMGWSILECLGEPGEAVSTCGDGMKRCTHTSDDKRGLSKRGHGLGASWGPRQSAGLREMLVTVYLGLLEGTTVGPQERLFPIVAHGAQVASHPSHSSEPPHALYLVRT